MRLDTLQDESCDLASRRSIMLVHLNYLGSIILLTRKIVLSLVTTPAGPPWAWDGTKEEARHYFEVCLDATRNVARIVSILYDDQVLFKRCWMIM